jgi:hypothetical protein
VDEEEDQPTYKVGDRVKHADPDIELEGTILDIDLAGQLTIQWDDWYTHPDQVLPAYEEIACRDLPN